MQHRICGQQEADVVGGFLCAVMEGGSGWWHSGDNQVGNVWLSPWLPGQYGQWESLHVWYGGDECENVNDLCEATLGWMFGIWWSWWQALQRIPLVDCHPSPSIRDRWSVVTFKFKPIFPFRSWNKPMCWGEDYSGGSSGVYSFHWIRWIICHFLCLCICCFVIFNTDMSCYPAYSDFWSAERMLFMCGSNHSMEFVGQIVAAMKMLTGGVCSPFLLEEF